MTGICEFCGQVVEVGDQAVPDEAAWQFCGCPDAKRQRRLQQQIEEAMEHVEELFGEQAGDYGMPQVQHASAVGLLRDAVVEVANGHLASVTAVIPGGGVAVIKMGSKLEIKVSRRISRTQTMEAGI